MARPATTAGAWADTRLQLQRHFDASSEQGVAAWIKEYADAITAGNADILTGLTTDAFPFPSHFAAVVTTHLRPGTDALRRGDVVDALQHLSIGSAAGSETLQPLVESFAHRDPGAAVRDATRYAARAFWLDAAGLAADAVTAYCEAGRFYGWDRETDAAALALQRAITLDPLHVESYWYLADVHLTSSYLAQPPYADGAAIQKALEAWNRGTAVRRPDIATSWAYVTRALISEQLARVRDAERVTLWWEGAGYLERALILDHTDPFRWAFLSRLHRLLGNEACAVHATREALARNPDDAAALEERAAVLANVGDFEEAEDCIDRRLAQDASNVWARGVKAFLHLHRKDYASAIRFIDEALAADPQSLWNLDVRATCSFLSGDLETARAYRERIWQRYTPALAADDRRICAMAAYHLGRYDDAIAVLEPLASEAVERGFTLRALGTCFLAIGNLARGEELLLTGLARANARELDDVLSDDLSRLEVTAPGWLAAPGGLASVARVKRTAAALAAELRRTPASDPVAAAESELQLVLQALAPERDATAAIAARAGIARLQTQNERWVDATETYEALPAVFLEAGLALRRTFQQLGESRWKANDSDEALRFFRKGLAAAGGDESFAAGMHCRLGLVQQHKGDAEGARREFIAARQLVRRTHPADAPTALAAMCRPLLRRVDDFWAVDAIWESLQNESAADRADFTTARAALTAYLDDVFSLSRSSDPNAMLPIVIPVALEVGPALVALVDPKADGGKFISRDISAMRDAIRTEMGMSVPGIRVRENPALGSGYTILLNEVAVAQGLVHTGFRYYPIALADLMLTDAASETVFEAAHPASGLPGCWCAARHWEALTAKGFAHFSETDFMLVHLSTILRHHLADFLGIQEVEAVVADLKQEGPLAAFLTAVLESPETRLAFARVLRALVREQVPISDLHRLLECVQQHGLDRVTDTVRAVRLHLRTQLPGNQPGVVALQIPDWTALVRVEAGMPILAVSPEAAHKLLLAMRQWLEARTAPIALVTATSELRPLVRRLIEYEFPAVSVLSRDEVTHPEQIVTIDANATLAHATPS
jgi:tetratricopeptide (TPR) repeat protein